MHCTHAYNGKHCDCPEAKSTKVCCFCQKRIPTDIPDTLYDDDGSEENKDA